jgi:hypothetical protein
MAPNYPTDVVSNFLRKFANIFECSVFTVVCFVLCLESSTKYIESNVKCLRSIWFLVSHA